MAILMSTCDQCKKVFPHVTGAFIEMSGLKYHLGDFCSRACTNDNIAARVSMETR